MVHPEILAAIAMALPMLTTIYWLCIIDPIELKNPAATKISGYACIVHFPWSALLHIYRAYGNNVNTRIFLYKMDVSFQHIYSLCTRYAFSMKFNIIEIGYHSICIFHTWYIDPIKTPKRKKIVDIASAIGLGSCALELINRDIVSFFSTIAIAFIGFIVHTERLLGDMSSFWFHISLAAPHYFILCGLNRS